MKSWLQNRKSEAQSYLRKARRVALPVYVVLLIALAPTLSTASDFESDLRLEQTTLERIGQGTAYYAGIIPVYDVALYTGPPQRSGQLLDPDVAKRLEIVYRVGIEASDLARAAEKTLARQHTPEQLARWRTWLDALHQGYRDVEAGDRYTLSYLPQRGLWLELNGEQMFSVQKPGFAAIYFGIWLGEKPLSEPLKLKLVSAAGAGN